MLFFNTTLYVDRGKIAACLLNRYIGVIATFTSSKTLIFLGVTCHVCNRKDIIENMSLPQQKLIYLHAAL